MNASEKLSKTAQLLEKVAVNGLEIAYENKLIVRYPADVRVDEEILSEIKANKEDLIEYFTRTRPVIKRVELSEAVGPDARKVSFGGELYYEITPTQAWWVNEKEAEFKRQIFLVLNFGVSGDFNIDIFDRAVLYLVSRHESLRSAFSKIEGEYMMRVLDPDSPAFRVEQKDFRNVAGDGDPQVTDFVHFRGHDFDIQNGPLFLVRLAHLGNGNYILAIKMHHVLCDGWSIEVLFTDLTKAYSAFAQGAVPDLPRLDYQSKEYSAYINIFNRRNYTFHRDFWYSKFKGLPATLPIRGEKVENLVLDRAVARPGIQKQFSLPQETRTVADTMARKHSTSYFVVLQSLLTSYLHLLTHNNDIVIGMQVFGRDELPGRIEKQIGCYIKHYVIRAAFDEVDNLDDCVLNLKRENSDMQVYNAFTLLDMFEEMLPSAYSLSGTFWKISVMFTDSTGYENDANLKNTVRAMPFETSVLPGPLNSQTSNINIKFDFVNAKEKTDLLTMYDSTLYDDKAITELVEGFSRYIVNIYRNRYASPLKLDPALLG